jgi:diguanylate cyclase (GGDEF)-like protein
MLAGDGALGGGAMSCLDDSRGWLQPGVGGLAVSQPERRARLEGLAIWPDAARPRLGSRLREGLSDYRDQLFIDAGISGELLVARVRIVLLLILFLIQIVPGIGVDGKRVAMPLTGLGLAMALAFLALASRVTRPWLGFLSSGADVSLVSLGLAAFLFLDEPHSAVNSRSIFDVYFLAIGCTSFRYNPRVCVLTGLLAVAQYAAIVAHAAMRWNLNDPRYAPFTSGTFDWNTQGARIALLASAAILATFIVLRSQRLQQMSATDRLTGVFNRSTFEQQLGEEADRARRYARPFAVAIVDVDHFKQFNDTHGHAGGDAVLRTVAQAIRRAVRKSDVVARYGGEEFALILPETNAELIIGKLEALRRAVAETKVNLGKRRRSVGVTVSIGVASWPDDGAEVEDVVACADERLYEAKHRGRDRTVGPPTTRQDASV